MSHTKGPWRWSDDHQARDLSDTYSLIGADGFGILSCDGLCNSPQHLNKADAALIADAPALLDELKHIVSRYESLVHDMFEGTSTIESRLAEADKARALIAKHRGGK